MTSRGYKADEMCYIYLGKLICIVALLQAGNPRKCGSIPGRGKRFFYSLKHSDRFRGPLSIMSNRCRGLSLVGKAFLP